MGFPASKRGKRWWWWDLNALASNSGDEVIISAHLLFGVERRLVRSCKSLEEFHEPVVVDLSGWKERRREENLKVEKVIERRTSMDFFHSPFILFPTQIGCHKFLRIMRERLWLKCERLSSALVRLKDGIGRKTPSCKVTFWA